MTDSELLELAAKAAGKEWTWAGDRFLVLVNPGDRYFGPWNALTDDGDALRLAVKLGLDVCIDTPHEREPHTHVIGFRTSTSPETVDTLEGHGDPYAATRRAIVRAAAAIGEDMP